MKSFRMKSGYQFPVLGLGTWKLNGSVCTKTVLKALELGYSHIDTAAAYGNEEEVGKAIRESGIRRPDLFITTKVWFDSLRTRDVVDACQDSLRRLRTDYIDLLLVHWPNRRTPIRHTLEGFKYLEEKKLVRSFGVSNFTISHLEEALKESDIPLSVNQVEFHPYLNQSELLTFCNEHKILVTAYSPIARGHLKEDPVLLDIAGQKNATPAQIALAWLRQKGLVAIPKASSEQHLKENMDTLQIELTDEQMRQVDGLNRNQRLVNPSWAEF
ncbi:MAG: aldo/keto reductase [Chitinispirillaceae bacterium]